MRSLARIAAAAALILLLAAPASSSSAAVSGWGDNTYGQLGNGTSGNGTASKVPVAVTGLSRGKAIAAGWVHNLALMDDGSVRGWGNNGAGGLGDGTITQRDIPVEVQGLTGVTAVAAGSGHSLALLENGTVMAWGRNYEGQLGLGTTSGPETCMSELSCSTHPVLVPGLTGVSAIAAGEYYSLALLNDGTVMAWGEGHWGQLGIGTTGLVTCGNELLCNPTPTPVSGLDEVKAISAGFHGSIALLKDGTVMTWGYNGSGQLGIGTDIGPETCGWNVSCSRIPVPVPGLAGVTAVAAGGLHDLALLEDGMVKSWGYNLVGQLGDGTNEDRAEPVPVSGLSGVTALSGGMYHSMALLENGTAKSWGWNLMWTLGNGSAGEESNTPVLVTGLTGVTGVAAGNMHSLALGGHPAALPKISKIEPNVGPTSGGSLVNITGTGLADVTSVEFGSVEAASFTIHSDTAISAVSPPGSGAVHVVVTNPEGSSYTSWRTLFWYGPAVHRVDPFYGPAWGGTRVVVRGVGFTDATSVKFGPNEAAEFQVVSDTEITATSPPGSGIVDVVVESPVGTSAISPWGKFMYWGAEGPDEEGEEAATAGKDPGALIHGLICGAAKRARFTISSWSGPAITRVCRNEDVPATVLAGDSPTSAVRLRRDGVLYATGTAWPRGRNERLVLKPLRSIKPGRYVLSLGRGSKRLRQPIVLRLRRGTR